MWCSRVWYLVLYSTGYSALLVTCIRPQRWRSAEVHTGLWLLSTSEGTGRGMINALPRESMVLGNGSFAMLVLLRYMMTTSTTQDWFLYHGVAFWLLFSRGRILSPPLNNSKNKGFLLGEGRGGVGGHRGENWRVYGRRPGLRSHRISFVESNSPILTVRSISIRKILLTWLVGNVSFSSIFRLFLYFCTKFLVFGIIQGGG